MKKLQQLLWLVGLLLGTVHQVAAQDTQERITKEKPNDTLKVGVSVEARGAYDVRNYHAEPDFAPAAIPMKSDRDNSKSYLFDISSAALNIEKEMPLSGKETVKLVVQTKLKKELALKSVYADFKGFRIGKATTNFCDPDACGLVGGNFVQVRWQYQLTPPLSFAVAMEQAPELVIYPKEKEEDRDKQTIRAFNNIPAVNAQIRYEQEKSWHIQASGLLRSLEYRNTDTKKNYYMSAWGINLSTAYHFDLFIPKQTTFKVQGVYGQGIGSYMADLGSLEKEVNTIYTKGVGSSFKTLDAWAVGLAIAHKWVPKWRSEAAYSVVYATDRQREKDGYKYGHAVAVNLFYHPTKQVKIGTEYLVGVRSNIAKNQKDAHRLQAVVGFEL